ncbi:MAG: flagellar motor protein MotB [Syntrophobacteraceae bacterium]|jgi:chemotaxis protein MotB
MATTKNGKNIPTKKNITTCYECGASFSIDLSKLAPTVLSMKCLNCGNEVPILARVIKAKPKDSSPASASLPEQLSGGGQGDPDESIHPAAFGAKPSSEAEGGEENMLWLATYGDMMSILLIFFVLMFAISTVDKRKFETAMTSISHALGGKISFPQAPPTLQPSPPPESLEDLQKRVEEAKKLPAPLELFKQQAQTEKQALSVLRQQLRGFIEEHQLQEKFTLLDENEGLILIAQDMVMFDLGRAEIRPEVLPNLKKIGSILSTMKNDIVVEGHTDDLPISSGRFASNWELSVMRATSVVHFFVSECGLDPSRLSAAGYAYYRPRYSNKSTDREKNRRIEIVVKKKYSDNLVDELLAPKP